MHEPAPRRDPPDLDRRVEPRFALGKEMGFDPLAPEANRGVNPGYHQLVLSTSFSRAVPPPRPEVGVLAVPKALDSSPSIVSLRREGLLAPAAPGRRRGGLEYVGYEQPAPATR
jgi:hypothetical protein